MKIGFFTDGYLPQLNGVAISVDACAKALERRGHEVYIIAPKYPGVKDEKNVIRITSIKYPENPDIRLATFIPGKSLLLASKVDFDIIHGHSGGPLTLLGWEVAKLKRVPFVITYHTLWNHYMHYILKGKIIRPKMAEVASRIFGNLCDTLVVPTKKVREELLSFGVEKPIEVIPNGLDISHFVKAKDQKDWLRQQLNIPSDKKILLYVGRLGKEKSVDYLLKSFAFLHKKMDDTVFVLVGDGTDKHKLQKLAHKLKIHDSVYFAGAIDPQKLPFAYAGSDVFIFASKSETQGMVVYEAMASGVPVITIHDDAYTEIIDDGITGLLVKGGPKAFATRVEELLRNEQLQKYLASQAFKKVEMYSIDQIALKLETLYKDLISKNSKKIDFPFKNLSKYLLLND